MGSENNQARRFNLIPLTLNHLEYIAQWYEDIDDLAMIESKLPVPISAQSLEKIWKHDLSQTEPRTCYMFTICDEQNSPVGYTGLQEINYAHGNGVVFVYVKRELRRQGVGLRSIALMLDLSFYQLRLHRVTTYIFEQNEPSNALINRCGFIAEGRMREACFFDGEYGDLKIVGMLESEWEKARGSLKNQLKPEIIASFGHNVETRWCWPPH